MNIGFIGAGKVGCSLGRYFVEHAHETGGAEEPYKRQESSLNVKGYYSRSSSSAKDAARFTHSKEYETIRDLTDECDVVFLTVPDGSIQETWQQVRECDDQWEKRYVTVVARCLPQCIPRHRRDRCVRIFYPSAVRSKR